MINLDGNDVRIDALNEIKRLGLPIFLWGGQVYGEYITEYLRENGIFDDLQIVVDDEYIDQNKDYMSLSEYLEKYAESSVMIFGFYNYKIVQSKFKKYKSKIKYLYDFRVSHVGNSLLKWDKNQTLDQIEKYEKTYEMLHDDRSKNTMQLYLRAAVNGEFEKLWTECYEKIAYFNEVTQNVPIDVLVDCGAFNGDDIHDFVDVFHGYNKIYAIEPDIVNIAQLKERIEEEKIERIEVIPKGVYKESTTLAFSEAQGVASHMDESGEVKVPVVALDEILEGCDGSVFIKMDIEGSEMDALVGASKIIREKHPCLAICVYHKENDLIKIPQYIDSLVEADTYSYYLRFHGLGLAELVFYAIPKKVLHKE